MEPYVSEDRLMPKESPNAFFASIMSGIKSTFEWKPSSGTGSLQLEYDAGATSSPRGRAKFHVVEMVGKVNYPVASSLFYIANPLKGLIGCLRKKPVVVSTIVPSEGTVGLVSDTGIQSVESSGTVADTTGQFVASTQQRIKL